MLPKPFENALVLTGPTGSGKTQLALQLASSLDAEIISMDSMAVYRHMDIGTAKPTPAERAAVPHHLIDVLDPWDSGSVAWWLEQARYRVADIEARGKQALIVGGTPLYLKALISGLFDGPPADDAIRKRLAEEAHHLGCEALHRRLASVDAVSAGRIHRNDVRRMIRALEVFELTGKPLSAWQTQWPAADGRQRLPDDSMATILCLDWPREELFARINQRVESMFAHGLVEEANDLRALEKPLSLEASQALGYRELFDLLDGAITCPEAIERVQTRSRQFAKRQMTWFRHLPGCRSVSPDEARWPWKPRIP